MILKKGAMFGLDARIALAIFGALSVVSGAALYSAIQESKVTSIIAEAKEIDKAVTAYMLDTGSKHLPISTTTAWKMFDAKNLVANKVSATGWSGPYVSYSEHTDADALVHPIYGQMGVSFRLYDEPYTSCIATSPRCTLVISFESIPAAIQDAIEEKLDGTGASVDKGKFSYTSGSWSFMALDVPFNPDWI